MTTTNDTNHDNLGSMASQIRRANKADALAAEIFAELSADEVNQFGDWMRDRVAARVKGCGVCGVMARIAILCDAADPTRC